MAAPRLPRANLPWAQPRLLRPAQVPVRPRWEMLLPAWVRATLQPTTLQLQEQEQRQPDSRLQLAQWASVPGVPAQAGWRWRVWTSPVRPPATLQVPEGLGTQRVVAAAAGALISTRPTRVSPGPGVRSVRLQLRVCPTRGGCARRRSCVA